MAVESTFYVQYTLHMAHLTNQRILGRQDEDLMWHTRQVEFQDMWQDTVVFFTCDYIDDFQTALSTCQKLSQVLAGNCDLHNLLEKSFWMNGAMQSSTWISVFIGAQQHYLRK